MVYKWVMKNPLEAFSLEKESFGNLNEKEVLVKIAGCGVCHTDIGFWNGGVKTRKPLPLTLGHEISGIVVDGPNDLLNKKVIIPAVIPCGQCDLCKSGRGNVCRKQEMPGNDYDGGFASHVKVPSRYLCFVPENLLRKYSLEHLAVVADAVSTPYQAIVKSGLCKNELAIIIGTGGIGMFAAMIAKAKGAHVLAMDIVEEKLTLLKNLGIENVLNIKNMENDKIKEMVRSHCTNWKIPNYGWKIFETSGSKEGQELAYSLMTFASVLSVIGFTMKKIEIRLSNLMAFDAKAIGTWGCKPELYNDVLNLLIDSEIDLKQMIDTIPMSEINNVFANTVNHKYHKRVILIPDFDDTHAE